MTEQMEQTLKRIENGIAALVKIAIKNEFAKDVVFDSIPYAEKIMKARERENALNETVEVIMAKGIENVL